jgi:hypothetical protein
VHGQQEGSAYNGHFESPEVDRQQAEGHRVAFRADAAFARPKIYKALETRGVEYAIRIRPTRT